MYVPLCIAGNKAEFNTMMIIILIGEQTADNTRSLLFPINSSVHFPHFSGTGFWIKIFHKFPWIPELQHSQVFALWGTNEKCYMHMYGI